MVERNLAKVEVAGSNPVSRSNDRIFLFYNLPFGLSFTFAISRKPDLYRPIDGNPEGLADTHVVIA